MMALMLTGAGRLSAEELVYKVGAAPRDWRLPLSEIPNRPKVEHQQQAPPPTTAPVGKFDRDFASPLGSPGFGAPLAGGFSPRGDTPVGSPVLPVRHDWPPMPRGINATLLLDCGPDHLFRVREDSEGRHVMLFREGSICTAHHWKFQSDTPEKDRPLGEVRPALMPPVKEALLSIVLGRTIPSGMSFRSQEAKGGTKVEVWREGGQPRILLKRRVSDNALTEAHMMAPGSTSIIEIWQVKAWEEGHPVAVTRFELLPENQRLASSKPEPPKGESEPLEGNLYTLMAASPSKNPQAKDVFGPGFMILDYRAALDSKRESFTYEWRGKLMDIAEMKQLDREKDAPLPDFLKGPNAAQGGVIVLGGACGLLCLVVWLSRKLAR